MQARLSIYPTAAPQQLSFEVDLVNRSDVAEEYKALIEDQKIQVT